MRQKTANQILQKTIQDYDTIAEKFSNTRAFSWRDFEVLKRYLPIKGRILDAGCGNGRAYKFFFDSEIPDSSQTYNLQLTTYDYVGLDASKELIKIARKNYPQGKFILGDLLKIPFGNNEFSTIWCIATLHHFPTKTLQENVLRELLRVTEPGGKLILTVWNLWQKKYLFKVIESYLKFSPHHCTIPFDNKIKRYVYAFTLSELRRCAKKAGWRNIQTLKLKQGEETGVFSAFNFCLIAEK